MLSDVAEKNLQFENNKVKENFDKFCRKLKILKENEKYLTNENKSILFKQIDKLIDDFVKDKKITEKELWHLDIIFEKLTYQLSFFNEKEDNFLKKTYSYIDWVKVGIEKIVNYIGEDIEQFIEFFSDWENIKKLPELVSFLFSHFDKILDKISDNAKKQFINLRDTLLILNQLHKKWEISDSYYSYVMTSNFVYFVWTVCYELFPLWKLSKISKVEDLEKIILQEIDIVRKRKKVVDVSNLDKKYIHNTLTENFPLLWVVRLTKGSEVYNFMFNWIKKLNDKFWQEKVDEFILVLKDKILSDLSDDIRVVRNNYKNLTIDCVGKKQLNIQLNDIIVSVLEELKNNPKFKDDYDEFRKFVLENFDIWIWKAYVKGFSQKDKLKAFYEAEISSKSSRKWEIVEYHKLDLDVLAQKAISLEKEIISKFENKWFELENKSRYPVVISIWDTKIINPILLRVVRKNKLLLDLDWNKFWDLEKYIKDYLHTLNKWFDFIAPYLDFKLDVKIAEKINKQIRMWKLDLDYFLHNFKWYMPKNVFLRYLEWKEWKLYFIDVKDMWILNLQDFRKLALQISEKGLENVDLTTAGKTVTQKFIYVVNNLKSKYPDLKISLWGDEIYVYWGGKLEILQDLDNLMKNSWLNWRIVEYNWKINSNILSNMDKITSSLKQLEDKIEHSLFTKGINFVPNIKLDFNSFVKCVKDIQDLNKIRLKIDNINVEDIMDWKTVKIGLLDNKSIVLKNEKWILSVKIDD